MGVHGLLYVVLTGLASAARFYDPDKEADKPAICEHCGLPHAKHSVGDGTKWSDFVNETCICAYVNGVWKFTETKSMSRASTVSHLPLVGNSGASYAGDETYTAVDSDSDGSTRAERSDITSEEAPEAFAFVGPLPKYLRRLTKKQLVNWFISNVLTVRKFAYVSEDPKFIRKYFLSGSDGSGLMSRYIKTVQEAYKKRIEPTFKDYFAADGRRLLSTLLAQLPAEVAQDAAFVDELWWQIDAGALSPKLRWVGMGVRNTLDEASQEEVPVLIVKFPLVPEVKGFEVLVNEVIKGKGVEPLVFHDGWRTPWKVADMAMISDASPEVQRFVVEHRLDADAQKALLESPPDVQKGVLALGSELREAKANVRWRTFKNPSAYVVWLCRQGGKPPVKLPGKPSREQAAPKPVKS